jgi:hypothetical protein
MGASVTAASLSDSSGIYQFGNSNGAQTVVTAEDKSGNVLTIGSVQGAGSGPQLTVSSFTIVGASRKERSLTSQFVFGLISLSCGVLILWAAWRTVQAVKASKSWPSVPGRIIGASCREDVTGGTTSDSADSETIWYTPFVQYEYQVGNQTYRGNRIAFSEERKGSLKVASKVLEAFPVGNPVTVFYDPAKPRDAVLQRREPGHRIFLAIMGLALVALGFAMMFGKPIDD